MPIQCNHIYVFLVAHTSSASCMTRSWLVGDKSRCPDGVSPWEPQPDLLHLQLGQPELLDHVAIGQGRQQLTVNTVRADGVGNVTKIARAEKLNHVVDGPRPWSLGATCVHDRVGSATKRKCSYGSSSNVCTTGWDQFLFLIQRT